MLATATAAQRRSPQWHDPDRFAAQQGGDGGHGPADSIDPGHRPWQLTWVNRTESPPLEMRDETPVDQRVYLAALLSQQGIDQSSGDSVSQRSRLDNQGGKLLGAIRMQPHLGHAHDLLVGFGNHEPRPGQVSGVEPGLPDQRGYGRLVFLTCLANCDPHPGKYRPSVRGKHSYAAIRVVERDRGDVVR